jgi:OOP family OmpA-OmpF porin
MKSYVIAGALALVALDAVADENRGFYLNAGVGQAKYDISQQDLDDVALAAFQSNSVIVISSNSSYDDKGSAWSLAGGYRFSPYVAVEVGYMDLGSTDYRATGPVFVPGAGIVNSTINIELSAKGPTVAAAGYAPLNEKFDVHGHLGMFFSDTTFDFGVGLSTVSQSGSVSGRSEDFFAGVGAAFHFTKNFALSLDYSAFKDVGDENETGEGNIDSLHLSVQYTF